jgi:hypothetical protein
MESQNNLSLSEQRVYINRTAKFREIQCLVLLPYRPNKSTQRVYINRTAKHPKGLYKQDSKGSIYTGQQSTQRVYINRTAKYRQIQCLVHLPYRPNRSTQRVYINRTAKYRQIQCLVRLPYRPNKCRWPLFAFAKFGKLTMKVTMNYIKIPIFYLRNRKVSD